MLKLKVLKREAIEKPEEVRAAGYIPAVFYGPKEASQSIKILSSDFEKAFKEAGESTVVVLEVDGAQHETLIHDVSYHPVRGNISHVDFYVIEKGKKVQVGVELEFVGVSPAEKTLGGTLMKVMHELEIEAMPSNLPHGIEVDISSLVDFESQIHAGDIVLPSGVTLITDADEVVALVQQPNEEVEEQPVEAVDISTIEVEKKGKKEEPAE
jgi:large subunit ribosomal protein L25